MSKYKKVLIGFLGCAVVAATFLCGRIVGTLDKSAAAISIIGGADGPTSVFLTGKAGGGESTEAEENLQDHKLHETEADSKFESQ